jgi:hypothetical protein
MDSIVWFIKIVAIIIAIIIAIFVIVILHNFMIEGGGCLVFLAIGLLILGIYAISGGGFWGGVGILLLIIGGFLLKFAIKWVIEYFKKFK